MTIYNDKQSSPNRAGVIAVITLTLLHIGACATRPDEIAANAQVTRDVRALLAQHAELGPPNLIYVQTLDHVVYLTGFVSEGTMRTTAGEVALAAPGVRRVVNTIAVTKS
jgi:osmotically-inducible protein OsmY